MKLIHITDPHLVPRGETLHGGDPAGVLATAIADINRHHADADLVTITGDLTHWGHPAAFETLAEVLAPLEPPLRLLIGNHDDRSAFAARFPDQPLDADGFVQSVWSCPTGDLIFLDTMLDGTHAGWFCERRRAWLVDRLAEAEAGDRSVFLFMHHPPFEIGLRPLDIISLQDKEAFAETLRPHRGRLRHLFFGHIHRPLAGSWLGIPISTLRGLNHQCWLDFDSRDEIVFSFEPPAYAVVLISTDSVIVHTHDFRDQSQKFTAHHEPVGDPD